MQTFRHISESVRVATPRPGTSRGRRQIVSVSQTISSHPSTPLTRANTSLEAPILSPRVALLQFTFAMLSVAAILSGCAANQKPRARAFPWATVKNVRPLAPEKTSADVSNEDLFADLGLDVPAPPSPVAGISSGPPRPRVAVAPAGNAGATQPPEAPMIAPQLSPEQTSAAQQQTAASVSVAERNIAASRGRTLNAMQSDLASKVRSFLAEAHEAVRVGDWTRASNAAKKAEVLSQELASSL